jgi:alkanesulfonate monooxygenase SsuD/methylene tetrahydromethanopterin reductase-like flavin-dependent oxidoreductase (luciferase family)
LRQALRIYRDEFQPSAVLSQPYTIGAINAYVADTEEEAQR